MKKQASLLRLSVVLRQEPVRLRPVNWLKVLPWRDSIWDGTRLRQASIWQPSIPDLAWLYAAYALMGLEPPQHHRVFASQRVSHASSNSRGWVRPALFSAGVEQKFLSAPSSSTKEVSSVGMRLPAPPKMMRKTQIASIAQDVTYVRAQEEKREVVAQQLRPVSLLAQAKISAEGGQKQEKQRGEKTPSLAQLRSVYAPKRRIREETDSLAPELLLRRPQLETSFPAGEESKKGLRKESVPEIKVPKRRFLEGDVSVSKRVVPLASLRAPVSMEGDAHQTMPWRRPVVANVREGEREEAIDEDSKQRKVQEVGRMVGTERRLIQPSIANEIVFTPAREGGTEEEQAQVRRLQKHRSIQQVARGNARIEAARLLRPQKKSVQEERTEVVLRKKQKQQIVSEPAMVEKIQKEESISRPAMTKAKISSSQERNESQPRRAKTVLERGVPTWSKPSVIEKTEPIRLKLDSGQVVSIPVASVSKFVEGKSVEEAQRITKQVARIVEGRKRTQSKIPEQETEIFSKRHSFRRTPAPDIVRVRQDSGQVVSLTLSSVSKFVEGKSVAEAERITKQVTRIVEERQKRKSKLVSKGVEVVSKRPSLSRVESPEIVRVRQDSGQVVSVPVASLPTFLQGKSVEESERITKQVTRIVEERQKRKSKLLSKGVDVASKRPSFSRVDSPEIVRVRQDSGQVVSVPVASLPTFLQGKSVEEAERITKQVTRIVEERQKRKSNLVSMGVDVASSRPSFSRVASPEIVRIRQDSGQVVSIPVASLPTFLQGKSVEEAERITKQVTRIVEERQKKKSNLVSKGVEVVSKRPSLSRAESPEIVRVRQDSGQVVSIPVVSLPTFLQGKSVEEAERITKQVTRIVEERQKRKSNLVSKGVDVVSKSPSLSRVASPEIVRIRQDSGQVVSLPLSSVSKFVEGKSVEEAERITKQVTRIVEERKKRPSLSRADSSEIVRIRQDSGQVVSVPVASLPTFLQGKSVEEAERITKQVTRIVEERQKKKSNLVSKGVEVVSKRPSLSRAESPEIVRIRQDSGQVVSVPVSSLPTFLQGKSVEEAERITKQVTRIVEERQKRKSNLVSMGVDVVSKSPSLSRVASPEIVRIRQDSGQVVSVPVASLPTFLQGKSVEEAERITKQVTRIVEERQKRKSNLLSKGVEVVSKRPSLSRAESPEIVRVRQDSGQVVSIPVVSLPTFLQGKSVEEAERITKQVTRIVEERKKRKSNLLSKGVEVVSKRPSFSRVDSLEIVRIRQDSGQVVSVPVASLPTFLQGKSVEEAERITKQVTRIVEERQKKKSNLLSMGVDVVSKRPSFSRVDSPEIVRIRQDSGQVVSVPVVSLPTFLQGKSVEEAERITKQVTRIVEERQKKKSNLLSMGVEVVSKRPSLSRVASPEIVRIRQDSGQVVSVPVSSLPTFLQGKSVEEAERITKQISYKTKVVEKKKTSRASTSTHVVSSVRRFLEKPEIPVLFRKELLDLIEKDVSVSIETVEEAIQQQILPPKIGKALVVILKQERVRQRRVVSSQSVPSKKFSSLRPMASVMRRAKQEIVQQSVSSQTIVVADTQQEIAQNKPAQRGFSRPIHHQNDHVVVPSAASRTIQFISKPTETVLPVSKGGSKADHRAKIPDPPPTSSQTSSRTKKEQPKGKYGPKKNSSSKVWSAPDSVMESKEEEIEIPSEREEQKQIVQKEKKKRKETPRKVNPKISDQLLLEILQELTEDKPEARQLLQEISTQVDFLKRLDDLRKL